MSKLEDALYKTKDILYIQKMNKLLGHNKLLIELIKRKEYMQIEKDTMKYAQLYRQTSGGIDRKLIKPN